MKDLFIKYFDDINKNVPYSVFEDLAIVFCIGTVIILAICGVKKGLLYLSGLLLAEYVFLLFCTTIVYRRFNKELGYELHPFWSYGRDDLIAENVMNVVVFVPVGLLLGCAFKGMTWWKVMMIGMCVSGAIETMQFVYKRGFAEVDDVMHNTLGCLIGYCIYSLIRMGYEKVSKRNVAIL